MSTPKTLESWESLLNAVRENEAQLPGVAPFRDTLTEAHARAHTLKAVRMALETTAGDARHRHRQAMVAGKDAAVALRGFLQSLLGIRNEKLLLYDMAPQGRSACRRRKPGLASRPTAKKGAAR
jgi:hypothetical protein